MFAADFAGVVGSALIGNKNQAKVPEDTLYKFCLSHLLPLMWLV